MNQLNQIILEGNLVEDVVSKDTLKGVKVAQFTVAVLRTFEDSDRETAEEVYYFDIEAYGNMVEVLSDRLKKGRGVRIVGRLKQSRWKDIDGESHAKVFVVAEHIEIKPFADKKGENACKSV